MNNPQFTEKEIKDCSNWIKQCINSCTDLFQLECCKTLMQLFEIKYEDAAWEYNHEILQVWIDKESMLTFF